MKREQFLIIMQSIQDFYQTFRIDEHVLGTWFKVLRDYDFWKIESNLQAYVISNRYPPTISDLVTDTPLVVTMAHSKQRLVQDSRKAEELIKQLENGGDSIRL